MERYRLFAAALLYLLCTTSFSDAIFKLGKKKKFMEGFLMGFVIGNEFGAHKTGGGGGKGGLPIPLQALAKHAMPMALKGTGVNTDDLNELMMNMKGGNQMENMSKTLMLRRTAVPKRRKHLRRVIKVKKVKYPIFVRNSKAS